MESHNPYGLNAIAYLFGAHMLANSLKMRNGWIIEMIYNKVLVPSLNYSELICKQTF